MFTNSLFVLARTLIDFFLFVVMYLYLLIKIVHMLYTEYTAFRNGHGLCISGCG